MKIYITAKMPGLDDQVKEQVNEVIAEKLINKFFEYGEYVQIELDTEDLSARVIEL